jgi:hypothetical protein
MNEEEEEKEEGSESETDIEDLKSTIKSEVETEEVAKAKSDEPVEETEK